MHRSGLLTAITAAFLVMGTPIHAQEVYNEPSFNALRGIGGPPRVDLPSTAGVPLRYNPSVQRPAPADIVPPIQPKAAVEAPKTIVKTVQPPVEAPAPKVREKTVYYAGMSLSGKVELLDGHNWMIDGHAVRLDGVETPGLAQRCSTASGTSWPCGKKVIERLSSLIRAEKPRCTVVEPLGAGASVTCSIRGINDLGQFLVQEGLAVPNIQGSKKYAGALGFARSNSAGLWIGRFENPEIWRRKNK